jgi:hypothetical protein
MWTDGGVIDTRKTELRQLLAIVIPDRMRPAKTITVAAFNASL